MSRINWSQWLAAVTTVPLMTLAAISWSNISRADAVTDWNAITAQAIVTAGRPAAIGVLDFALVHAAVYDAVEAIDRRFEPYHVVIPGAAGSPAAAAAKAAHDVLLNLFPAQAGSLDTTYHTYLADQGLAENDPGVDVGQQAAAGILALRANDGRFPPNPVPFTGGTDPGVWRPTPSYLPGPPPSLAPGLAPWLGAVTPFTLLSPSQFRADPPPQLSSQRYTREYNEVKELGSFLSSARTAEQTDLAYFWADNIPLLWYRGLRAIADTYVDNIGDSARLFALVGLATADAAITAWDTKYTYIFWRPVTAIQEGDSDGNRKTVGDPSWQPFINTPNYPEYTSGANNFTGALTRILQLFFGTDRLSFSLTSLNPQAVQKTHTYSRLREAAQEVVDVRIWQGIHFRTADEAARDQGRRVAQWTFKYFLQPLGDGHPD